MQKVLYSLLVIGIVSSIVVGSGAIAYFNDVETSGGNTFAAGTLDLKVNNTDTTTTTVSVSNKAPGDNGSGATLLTNAGTLNGELDIKMSPITQTAGTSGEHAGGKDLANNLKMVLWLDANRNHKFENGDIELHNDSTYTYCSQINKELNYVNARTYDGVSWDAVRTMGSNHITDFTINWKIPKDVGNEIQGDSMSFDVTFTLEQANKD